MQIALFMIPMFAIMYFLMIRPERKKQADAQAQAEKCTSAGKPGMTVRVFNDQNAVNLALSSGRAQVAMADSPVAAYQVKQSNGTFKVTGSPYGTAPYGIAIPQNNGMADPILAAVKHLMSDGTYAKILGKSLARGWSPAPRRA